MLPLRGSRSPAEIAVRLAADALMVGTALWIAVTLRYLGVVVFEPHAIEKGLTYVEMLGRYFDSFVILVLVSLAVFWFAGFYTYGRAYQSRYRALVIVQAVSIAYLTFGFLAFLFYGIEWFPRTALLLGWMLTVALLVASRLWSRMWKGMAVREQALRPAGPTGEIRNVLVVGGAGYIGSALVRKLLDRGYRVRLLDLCLFGTEPIRDVLDHERFQLIQADFRHLEKVAEAVKGMDALVHLGGIVGDPACAVDEALTVDVNVVATRMLAEIAKGSGVSRFVFASSCSVYGASDEVLDEHSTLAPLSLYAKSKTASETVLREMASPAFCPVILRFATIYGLSGRTRFDLVVNLLAAKAVVDRKITVFGGSQWRPFVHVEDAALAVVQALAAPAAAVHNEIVNVGSDGQNRTILQVGERIRDLVPGAELVTEAADTDARNYRVSFAKARRLLGFEPEWTLDRGILQVVEAFRSGRVADYRSPQYHNVKFLTEEGASKLVRSQTKWIYDLMGSQESPS
jgi:nucleoside-diphosphate-sugar epimerase